METQQVRRGMQLLRKKWFALKTLDGTHASLLWYNDQLLEDGTTVIDFCIKFIHGPHSRRK